MELNKLPVVLYSGVRGDTVGPGQYDVLTEIGKGRKRGASWVKQSTRGSKPSYSNVGPGYYETS